MPVNIYKDLSWNKFKATSFQVALAAAADLILMTIFFSFFLQITIQWNGERLVVATGDKGRSSMDLCIQLNGPP